MSYDDDSLVDEEQGFKLNDGDSDDDLDESLEPLEGATGLDFDDEDPDSRYH